MIQKLLNKLGYIKYTPSIEELLVYPSGTIVTIKINGKPAMIDWVEIKYGQVSYNVQWWDEAEQLVKSLNLNEGEFTTKYLVEKKGIGFK